MGRTSLFRHIFIPHILVVCGALLAVTWLTSGMLRDFWIDQAKLDLTARARLFSGQFQDPPDEMEAATVDSICKTLGKQSNTRLTVISLDGEVLGDSEKDLSQMADHSDRPEIREAYSGNVGTSTRFSSTIQETFMYVALPLEYDGKISGVVRVSVPVTFIDQGLQQVRNKIAFAGIVVGLVATFISFVISRRIADPLIELKQGAVRFAQGDLEHQLEVPNSFEIGALATAMNEMASQLDERIKTVVQQRNEQEAVLSSMLEGVLAVDTDSKVISLNVAAGRLLEAEHDAATGKSIHDIMRNVELQGFVDEVLAGQKSKEQEICIGEQLECVLLLRGTVLKDSSDKTIGAVIVLNDITRLRRLENVRREFVANVSHELRTPITSIKGFVETVLDGTLDDKDETRRFLNIVAGQADRLNAIIEDLLSLSRLEDDEESGRVLFGETDIGAVLDDALQVCGMKAKENDIIIEVRNEITEPVRANGPLLEQAVINLLDNAVKYSNSGERIQLRAGEIGGEIVVSVADNGCGIAKDHLPRLFERFYRVDKARSRSVGGTGLGLSIVKHISRVHGGRVSVESEPGKGSTFSLHFPKSIPQKNIGC